MGQPIEPTLHSVARIAGELGHELNNQLAAVLNYTYVLSRRVDSDAQASEYLGELREAAWRASGLAEQLLTFSHAQRTPSIGTCLRAIMSELQPLLLHGLDPDRELEVLLADDLHAITVARGAIESVLLRAALIKHRSGHVLGPLVIEATNARLSTEGADGASLERDFVRLRIGPLPARTAERRMDDGGTSTSTESQLLSERVRSGLADLGARLETHTCDDAITITAYLPAAT